MSETAAEPESAIKLETRGLNLYYGSFHALSNITFGINDRSITAIIGPSGCGKSSLLRIFNRMNDLVPGVRIEGDVLIDGVPIYGKNADPVALRKKVGMVFQKPNVFPISIYNNVAIGPKHHGIKGKNDLDRIVETSLTQAALWEEVKDGLQKPGLSLSPGQQQRLCIARALAVEPEVILMDESCSALDPESIMRIEDLMLELVKKYTIIIVTHSMEQARRISDMSAFLMLGPDRVGTLVEYTTTFKMFTRPDDKRTEDYITGRFG